eukprot:SAG31_NODE_17642_length_663_cov_1.140071_1_plen_66_part_00
MRLGEPVTVLLCTAVLQTTSQLQLYLTKVGCEFHNVQVYIGVLKYIPKLGTAVLSTKFNFSTFMY